MVAPGKHAMRGVDPGTTVRGKRRQADVQQPVAGLPLCRGARAGLFRQRFAKQS
jgi:hypothetical protein